MTSLLIGARGLRSLEPLQFVTQAWAGRQALLHTPHRPIQIDRRIFSSRNPNVGSFGFSFSGRRTIHSSRSPTFPKPSSSSISSSSTSSSYSPSSLQSRFYSSRPNPDPTPHLGSPEATLSLSQRLRVLSREYGWSALGVYLALSVLDFPFCYLAVRWLGAERVGHWEHAIVSKFWDIVHIPFPNLGEGRKQMVLGHDGKAIYGHDQQDLVVERPREAKGEEDESASIWTQLALAYAVHKSLIVFRVPLTAAVLPKVVKTLRGWGWNIGKRSRKSRKST